VDSTTTNPRSILLIGFTVDDEVGDEISRRTHVMPTQTHNFARNLVRSLTSTGAKVYLLSAFPVPNYPEYPDVLIRGRKIQQSGAQGLSLGFVNLMVFKHLTRLYSCATVGMRFARKVRPDVAMVHGVHTPFLLFAVLLRLVLRVKICLIMTDPPGVIRSIDGSLSRFLKRLDRAIVRLLASAFHGVIALTPALAEEFAPGTKTLIMEGFVDEKIALPRQELMTAKSQYTIAYAGGISESYGVRNLVLAFHRLEDANLTLHLYGRGPLEDWVRDQCVVDPRMHFNGAIAHQELIVNLRQVDMLVNARPADQPFVKYSFPSKLLEYIALGVPVVTTRLSGIPDDYFSLVEVVDDDSVESLERAMRSVYAHRGEAEEKAERAQTYVVNEKSTLRRGALIQAFLTSLG
jgi:Glycosyltransferase